MHTHLACLATEILRTIIYHCCCDRQFCLFNVSRSIRAVCRDVLSLLGFEIRLPKVLLLRSTAHTSLTLDTAPTLRECRHSRHLVVHLKGTSTGGMVHTFLFHDQTELLLISLCLISSNDLLLYDIQSITIRGGTHHVGQLPSFLSRQKSQETDKIVLDDNILSSENVLEFIAWSKRWVEAGSIAWSSWLHAVFAPCVSDSALLTQVLYAGAPTMFPMAAMRRYETFQARLEVLEAATIANLSTQHVHARSLIKLILFSILAIAAQFDGRGK